LPPSLVNNYELFLFSKIFVDRDCSIGFECADTPDGKGDGCRIDCPPGEKIVPEWGVPIDPSQSK